jgi:hypothetical protein
MGGAARYALGAIHGFSTSGREIAGHAVRFFPSWVVPCPKLLEERRAKLLLPFALFSIDRERSVPSPPSQAFVTGWGSRCLTEFSAQFSKGSAIRNQRVRLVPQRAHCISTDRRPTSFTVTAAWSCSRLLPPQRKHAIAKAWGSTCDADSTSIGLSGVPPDSARARRSRSRASFSAARSVLRRSVRADGFRLATPKLSHHCVRVLRSSISSTLGDTMSSHRRFFCRPSSVSLLAIGSVSANPVALQ